MLLLQGIPTFHLWRAVIIREVVPHFVDDVIFEVAAVIVFRIIIGFSSVVSVNGLGILPLLADDVVVDVAAIDEYWHMAGLVRLVAVPTITFGFSIWLGAPGCFS